MTDKRQRALSELPHRVRDEVQHLPDRLRDLREGFRKDPSVFLSSRLVRLGLVLLLAVLAIFVVNWFIGGLTPSTGAGRFEEPTPWATLYVACTNPDCLAHSNMQVTMDFDQWPLTCEKCEQQTVYRATRCAVCRDWYAQQAGQADECPHCEVRAHQRAAEQTPDRPQQTGDDAQDPW